MNPTDHIFLTCKDHSVSGENFELIWNEHQDILITSPQPSLEDLPNYYESEDYISHTDASKTLVDKAYQWVKRRMLSKKLQLINSFSTEEKTLLDVGAGTGDFLHFTSQKDWKVSGVEPNEKARKLAKAKGIDLFENLDAVKNQQFDVITLWHVLEHVPNLEEQIQQLKNLLKSDGVLVIAVPNFESYDAQHYKEYWAAYDVPRHLWHFSKKGITRIFKEHEMELKQLEPLNFDSFYVSLLSEKYKNNASHPLKAFSVGLKSNLKAKSTKNHSSLIYCFKKLK